MAEKEGRTVISAEFRVKLKDVVEIPKSTKEIYFPDWATAGDYRVLVYVNFTKNFLGDGKTVVRVWLYDKDVPSRSYANRFTGSYFFHFLLRKEHQLVFDKLVEIAEEKIKSTEGKDERVFVEFR